LQNKYIFYLLAEYELLKKYPILLESLYRKNLSLPTVVSEEDSYLRVAIWRLLFYLASSLSLEVSETMIVVIMSIGLY
jgi:hypothetical protein